MNGWQHRVPLAENDGLAFAGAHVKPGLVMGRDEADRVLAARNRHGKPNADVLRPYVDVGDLRNDPWVARPLRGRVGQSPALGDRGRPPAIRSEAASGRWVADFPADLSPEEASLYAEPWRRFARAGGVLHARANPMRIAIARVDSFLATPLGCAPRGFARVDSAVLPGAGLVVVASDDDFIAAILHSGIFAAWVAAHGGRLRVWHVASFPFPWPPRTERGALTRAQLELRDRVVRASEADLDDAVAVAYGWRDIADEADLVNHLHILHEDRGGRYEMRFEPSPGRTPPGSTTRAGAGAISRS